MTLISAFLQDKKNHSNLSNDLKQPQMAGDSIFKLADQYPKIDQIQNDRLVTLKFFVKS